MLNITTKKTGTALEIALEGLLDTKTTPQLEKVIEENIADVTEMHFDMAKLEYLTSAGLRALLAARQGLADKGGSMTLKNVTDDIMEIFEMTGFSAVLTIV